MLVIKDKNHFHCEIAGGVGDEVQFNRLANGRLDIEICEPWAGSTETGFGSTSSITLSKEQVIALRDWLNQ